MKKLLFTILLLSAVAAHAQNCTSTRYRDEVFTDVDESLGIQFGQADPYGLLTSQDLRMDIYMPAGDDLEKRPLIIYAFGGGFLIGLRNQPPIPQFCQHYARLGYVVASIDYRIGFTTTSSGSAERAVYRGVQDLRAAMRFLAQNSAVYGIDTSNIFLTGSSAGCFSALHSTFMTDAQRPQSTFGILLEPEDMECSDCSGNTYFNNDEIRPKGIINNWGAMLDTNFIDPTAFDNVPVISFHGTDDLIVPYNSGSPFSYPIFPTVHGSSPIHQRLQNLGIMNQLVPLQGIGHEPWLTNAALLDTVYRYSQPFLYTIMQPQTSPIAGDALVTLGNTRSYAVVGEVGSNYCWSVTNGTIVSENGNTIDVLWNTIGTGQVSVVEVSCIEVLGEEQTLVVEVVEPTGVNESALPFVAIYPNPASSHIILQLSERESAPVPFKVYDALGKMVLSASVPAHQQSISIDVAALPAGIYAITVQTTNNPTTFQWIKSQN